jgi:RNA:NAD 2'-phosphotransferase (TPT1/KptA family)
MKRLDTVWKLSRDWIRSNQGHIEVTDVAYKKSGCNSQAVQGTKKETIYHSQEVINARLNGAINVCVS